jgi:uncharacterized phage-associated protein
MVYYKIRRGEVSMSKVTVFDVADYFLSKSVLNTDTAITHLKLQKLVYYAQAWYVTAFPNNGPLFPEDIEAWVHGPVCRELYYKYRSYGYEPIPPKEDFPRYKFTDEQISILEAVWEVYGHLDGKTLESITHSENPWREARGTLKDGEHSSNIITIESMRNYYSKLNN